ncbi:uncharacterized protein LOC127240351 [Andrographis paniculata]|uniref:uncharacterized protein LOC127240351 n=1 Tax=Andrographis paniculata TaxID=175694 RepID=UPI0021E76B94|nr:uncharacterized protein LOC127240351 [Andrographis paniculata]
MGTSMVEFMSPQVKAMSKKFGPGLHSGAHTSPGSPECINNDLKSWTVRRHSALIPLSNGKTPPSKWDDAERWITSPVSGDRTVRTPVGLPRRKVMSKSGPLGGSGVVHSTNCSPSTPVLEGRDPGSFMDELHRASEDSSDVGNNGSGGVGKIFVKNSKDEEKIEDRFFEGEEASNYNGTTSIKMSYKGSARLKKSLSFSTLVSSIHTDADVVRDKVLDVQVDKGALEQSKKQDPGKPIEEENKLEYIDKIHSPFRQNASKTSSKLQKEEAKISAWENLQKSKAEEAIQKLELKLEKKRLASMKKIMSKLKTAEMKAETMRNVLSEKDRSSSSRIPRLSFCSNVEYSVRHCFVHRGKN